MQQKTVLLSKQSSAPLSRQRGVGLIEVMVTVLILSTALMALAALQTRSLQYNSSAYLRSQANIIAYNIMDSARIISSPEKAPNSPSQTDIDALAKALPNGTGSFTCAGHICTVKLTWTEPVAKNDGSGAEQTSFSYQSRI